MSDLGQSEASRIIYLELTREEAEGLFRATAAARDVVASLRDGTREKYEAEPWFKAAMKLRRALDG